MCKKRYFFLLPILSIGSAFLAFFTLFLITIAVVIVYKLSQVGGKYAYSPLSAITVAEFFKLCMSAIFFTYHVYNQYETITNNNGSFFKYWIHEIITQTNYKAFFSIGGLGFCYFINNQLTFILFLYIDTASVTLFKSFSSLQTAILLWLFFSRAINKLQWVSICLQVIGLIIVQYDPCKHTTILTGNDYLLLILSTSITSLSSVWNEYAVKQFTIELHLQNMILYLFGVVLNSFGFFLLPFVFPDFEWSSISFFQGYNTSVFGVILCNSVIGIVITAVYKYADAVIKTFSTACATAALLFINLFFFHTETNINAFLGSAVVFIAAYIYFATTASNVSQTPMNVNNNNQTVKYQVLDNPTSNDKEDSELESIGTN